MNPGDLVYYDRYGGRWESVSPSTDDQDYGLGVVVSSVFTEWWYDDEINFVCIMKEDGVVKEFSTSYVKEIVLNT